MSTPPPAALLAAVDDLTRRSTDPIGFGRGVNDLLARWIPYDFSCFATLDPATTLVTGICESRVLDDADDETFAHYEYAVDDVNQFSEIATRDVPTGILREDTGGHPEVSARFRDYLVPRFGFTQELRAVFRSRGLSWGCVALNRTGSRGFTAREAELLAGIGEAVALGVRRSLFASAPRSRVDLDRPAVLVVGPDNGVAQRTPAVDAVLDLLEDTGDRPLPSRVLNVVAATRARPGESVTSRVRTGSGHWLVLHGEALVGEADVPDVVVVVEPASPRHLTPLALETYGLTNREQEVAQLVLRGLDTRGISETLHLSAHTVQDHLKAVFAKAGVTSRRELVAQVFFDHHAPALGAGLLSDGSPASRPVPTG